MQSLTAIFRTTLILGSVSSSQRRWTYPSNVYFPKLFARSSSGPFNPLVTTQSGSFRHRLLPCFGSNLGSIHSLPLVSPASSGVFRRSGLGVCLQYNSIAASLAQQPDNDHLSLIIRCEMNLSFVGRLNNSDDHKSTYHAAPHGIEGYSRFVLTVKGYSLWFD